MLTTHLTLCGFAPRSHNGAVSRQEFSDGVRLVNSRLPADQQLGGDEEAVEALFDAVDTDQSGEISLEELTEAFRLTVVKR